MKTRDSGYVGERTSLNIVRRCPSQFGLLYSVTLAPPSLSSPYVNMVPRWPMAPSSPWRRGLLDAPRGIGSHPWARTDHARVAWPHPQAKVHHYREHDHNPQPWCSLFSFIKVLALVVVQSLSCTQFCDLMDCSMPCSSVLHYPWSLLKFMSI